MVKRQGIDTMARRREAARHWFFFRAHTGAMASSQVRYCVGVEGFNMRHSAAVLATPEGKIRASVRSTKTMTLQATDADTLVVRLNSLLTELVRRAGLPRAALERTAVCLSLTGVTFSFDRLVAVPRVLADANLTFGRLICTGDAEVTFASHAQCMQGSLIVSHSGSTAYAVGERDGQARHYRFGGWGPAIGDEGSGYWIGREALRAMGLEHDSHLPNSLLWEKMRAWIESPIPHTRVWDDASNYWHILMRDYEEALPAGYTIDPRTLLYGFAHRIALRHDDDIWRKTVCGLAIPVMQAYEEGDPAAVHIVHEAVRHLAEQHRGACDVARKRADAFLFLLNIW
jgi:N-acetylglucosamine kinase-like BadF-type ATPase